MSGDFGVLLGVGERELALLKFEDRDVGDGSRSQRSQFVFAAEKARGRLRDSQDDITQRQSKVQELVHRGDEIKHGAMHVVVMDVAADEVGEDPLLQECPRHADVEARHAMTDIQQHAVSQRIAHGGQQLPFGIDQSTTLAVIAVRQHVARFEFREYLFDGERRSRRVNDQRQTDSLRRRSCQRESFRLMTTAFREVRSATNLDAADHVTMFGNDTLDVLDAAIPQVMQFTERGKRPDAADHPLPRNVQQREDACLRRVDDEPSKAIEDQTSRRSKIDDGRDATRKARRIRLDPEVTHAGKDMHVKVDQPRYDIATAGIDRANRPRLSSRFEDRGDSTTIHSHIATRIQTGGGINHMSIANQQVIHGGGFVRNGRQYQGEAARKIPSSNSITNPRRSVGWALLPVRCSRHRFGCYNHGTRSPKAGRARVPILQGSDLVAASHSPLMPTPRRAGCWVRSGDWPGETSFYFAPLAGFTEVALMYGR